MAWIMLSLTLQSLLMHQLIMTYNIPWKVVIMNHSWKVLSYLRNFYYSAYFSWTKSYCLLMEIVILALLIMDLVIFSFMVMVINALIIIMIYGIMIMLLLHRLSLCIFCFSAFWFSLITLYIKDFLRIMLPMENVSMSCKFWLIGCH